jgi:hypothetical protein
MRGMRPRRVRLRPPAAKRQSVSEHDHGRSTDGHSIDLKSISDLMPPGSNQRHISSTIPQVRRTLQHGLREHEIDSAT